MPAGRNVRLDIIDEAIGSDESVIVDVLALLFDPGGGLKKREAEGYLVLTSRRLIFATAKHGILVDLLMREIHPPVTVTRKFNMARVFLQTDGSRTHTLIVNKTAAKTIADVVTEAAAA